MPDYVIKTDFRAADRLSPVLKRIGINVEKLGNDATRSFRRASKGASVFGGVLKGVLAAGVVSKGFMYAGMGVRSLGETFLEFDKNTTSAIAKLRNNLDRSSQAFTTLGKSAREAATVTEFSAGDTSKAVEQLVMAGLNENQVLAALTPTLNLATNANIDVSEATRMAMKSLGAFGLRVDDAAQLQKNLTRVNNVFARAVSDSTLEMQDLFEVLIYAGPAMNSAGQSIETFSAMAAILADNSIDASIAGTSLRMAFLRLASQPAAAKAAIKKLGLQIKDSSGNFLDFADIIEQLQDKTKKMGNVQKLATMNAMFGVRAQNAMNILVREGADKLKRYRASLDASGGAGQRMAKIMRESIIARLLQLKSNLIELGFKFVEVFAEKGGKGIDRLTKAVRNFDPKPLIQDLKKIFHVIKDDIIPILPAVAIGFVALEASLKAVTAVAAVKFFFDLAKAVGALGVGTTAAAIASMAFLGFVVFGLATALGIVVWKYDELVAEFEIGFTHMRIWSLEFTVFFRNAFETVFNWFVNKINWVIKALFPLLSYFEIELPTIDMSVGTDQARKEIEETKKLLNSLREEASGQDAQRGMAGKRGFHRDPTVVAAEQAAEQSRIQGLLGMSFSDPDKANKALAGYIANAKALSEFAGSPGAGLYKAPNLDNANFLSTIDRNWKSPLAQQPENGQLEIHVTADPSVAAEWKYSDSRGTKQGKTRKAPKLKQSELGENL